MLLAQDDASACSSREPPFSASISTPSTSSLIRYRPRANLAVLDEIVERDHRHHLAAVVGVAGDRACLMLGAGQLRDPALGADRALHDLKRLPLIFALAASLAKVCDDGSIAIAWCAPKGVLDTSTDQ